jgi:hypothetical protein
MGDVARRLRAVRRVQPSRRHAHDTKHVAFIIYAGGLALAVLGSPAVHAFALVLEDAEARKVFQHPAASDAIIAAGGIGLAVCVRLGRIRGPALLSPFLVAAVGGSDMPRSRTLLRPLLLTCVGPMSMFLLAGVSSGVIVSAVSIEPSANTVTWPIAAACFGALNCFFWLLGQALTDRWANTVSALILLLVVLARLVPELRMLVPWGWFGLAWPNSLASGAWPILLASASCVSILVAPRLLKALPVAELMQQSARWHSARTSALIGDAANAFGVYRARPAFARSWRAIGSSGTIVRFLRRDIVGALRTPLRCIVGAFGVYLSGALMTGVPLAPQFDALATGALAGVIGYLGIGVFTDGFRHAADAAGAPRLYGYSPAMLYALHGLFPSLIALACALVTFLSLMLTHAAVSVTATSCTILSTLLLVLLRAYDSARGGLPPSLMLPIPTVFGDLSAVALLAWQFDALILSGVIAAGLRAAAHGGEAGAMIAVAAPASIVVVHLTHRRVRSLLR